MDIYRIYRLTMPALWQTLYMVGISSIIAILAGLVLGVLLVIARPGGIMENRAIYRPISILIDATRAVPYFILMLFMLPVSKIIVGTKIGPNASIVALSLAASVLFARLTESALIEVPQGVVEAARSMGAGTFKIICSVLLPESLPSLIRACSTVIIGIVGYSAMAGAVGGGGLGDLAVRYGFHRYQTDVMLATVLILTLMVLGVQFIANTASKKTEEKRGL